MIACRKQFTDTLLELARQDKDIIAVTTDARGSVTLGDYASALPEQFVECGIAEQNAVGIAAGLAHSGKKSVLLWAGMLLCGTRPRTSESRFGV